ncbi:MAG: DNA polymerase III subunit delta [Burkholderiales bacterium]|nr:DNA polymerase III subunit delta [Burkholderiales bacterium]
MLNLNKFFQANIEHLNSFVISFGEEYGSLANYIEDYIASSLIDVKKDTFLADRYFSFDVVKEIFLSSSLFGDSNLVIVRFKTKPTIEQSKQLLELIKLVNSENRLLLQCDKLDKKDLASGWVGAFDDILILSGDSSESRVWINHMLKASGITIQESALELLLNLNQNNYTQLRQEVHKFTFLYPANYEINYEDALEQLTDNAQFNVFALSNAYLMGDVNRSLKIFSNVCIDSENVILLIWLISEDIRKLLQIKNAVKNGQNIDSAIASLRVWGDAVNALKFAHNRLSYNLLLSILDEIARVDLAIKGLLPDSCNPMLEKIVMKFCQKDA